MICLTYRNFQQFSSGNGDLNQRGPPCFGNVQSHPPLEVSNFELLTNDEMMTEGDMPLLTMKSYKVHKLTFICLYIYEICVIYIYIYIYMYIYIYDTKKYNQSITWPNTANLCLALEVPTIAGFWRIWILYGATI